MHRGGMESQSVEFGLDFDLGVADGPHSDLVDVGDSWKSGPYYRQSHVVNSSKSQIPSVCISQMCRPGPPVTTSGASPTYFVPWKVSNFLSPLPIHYAYMQVERDLCRIKFR